MPISLYRKKHNLFRDRNTWNIPDTIMINIPNMLRRIGTWIIELGIPKEVGSTLTRKKNLCSSWVMINSYKLTVDRIYMDLHLLFSFWNFDIIRSFTFWPLMWGKKMTKLVVSSSSYFSVDPNNVGQQSRRDYDSNGIEIRPSV